MGEKKDRQCEDVETGWTFSVGESQLHCVGEGVCVRVCVRACLCGVCVNVEGWRMGEKKRLQTSGDRPDFQRILT